MSHTATLEPVPFVDFPDDIPVADIPVADAPAADVPVAEVPVADALAADVPEADAPVADVPVDDVPVDDVWVVSPARAETQRHTNHPARRSTTAPPQTRHAASSTGATGVLMAMLSGAAYAWIGFQLILGLTVGVARASADGPAFAIESGSMQPALPIGSVVVTKPVDFPAVRESDIVSFHDPTKPGRVITHRVVDTSGGALKTQGDANAQPDSTPVPPQSILGRAFVVIPAAAKPVVWIQHGSVVPLALWILSCLVATSCIQGERRMSRRTRPASDRANEPQPVTDRGTSQAAWT